MTKVAIIQREIPHYRVRFFEEVHAQAQAMGLDVTVYSTGTHSSPGFAFPHRGLPSYRLGKQLSAPLWMRGLTAALRGAEIIVAPQELQCANVPYLWARLRSCRTWIWWGHGYNFQSFADSSIAANLKEALKRFMTRRSAGILTYTERGAAYWRTRGMPPGRVIPYFNTIDVRRLRAVAAQINEDDLRKVRAELDLDGRDILVFSGELRPEKEVAFLLRAFSILEVARPGVALLIIGDGDDRSRLEALRDRLHLQHAHFLGEVVDPIVSSRYFRLAELLVLPGAVGLAIVHGFVFDLPLVTTGDSHHGPEIEYLTPENGLVTPRNEHDYAEGIRELLASPGRLRSMRTAAHASGDRLLLEGSVGRFVAGIVALGGTRGREAVSTEGLVPK